MFLPPPLLSAGAALFPSARRGSFSTTPTGSGGSSPRPKKTKWWIKIYRKSTQHNEQLMDGTKAQHTQPCPPSLCGPGLFETGLMHHLKQIQPLASYLSMPLTESSAVPLQIIIIIVAKYHNELSRQATYMPQENTTLTATNLIQ